MLIQIKLVILEFRTKVARVKLFPWLTIVYWYIFFSNETNQFKHVLVIWEFQVDISDALSEKDKVKFTVHTRTSLPEFQKSDFFVVRQHEEFIWLHDRFEENEQYAGFIVIFQLCFEIKYLSLYNDSWSIILDTTSTATSRFWCQPRKIAKTWWRRRRPHERRISQNEGRTRGVKK